MAQTSSRRGVLGAVLLAPLAALPAVAGATGGDDAELAEIGREASPLVAEYRRMSRVFFSTPCGSPELEVIADAMQPGADRLDELLDHAAGLRAATAAGLAVKATLLRHQLLMQNSTDGVFDEEDSDADIRLAWSLCNDLLGEDGA